MNIYSLEYSIAETSRLLKVNRETLEEWNHHFKDYLSPTTNQKNDKKTKYLINDIRVLAYISFYWEEDSDIENIKYGLNSNSHFDNEIIDNFVLGIIPLFRMMPEFTQGYSEGIVFGGEFEFDELITIADSFKLAADNLVDVAIENYREKELFLPIIYNYRHATELYLKAIVGIKHSHNLLIFQESLNTLLKEKFNIIPPIWFKNVIKAFNDTDPKGTAFRYGEIQFNEELYADLKHIKVLMDWFSESIHRINLQQENE